jgi:hypothetical protein
MCGAWIFFHTNGNGDCVFFNSLGKPWPKHECFVANDAVERASRHRPLMNLVDLVVPPTHIALPAGVGITEFDASRISQVVIGVVLSFKRKGVWWSGAGTTVRKKIDVQSVLLQTAADSVIRVYTPVGFTARVGQVFRMSIREEFFDGHEVMHAEAGGPIVPEGDEPEGNSR